MPRWLLVATLLLFADPVSAQTLAQAFEQAWSRHPQARRLDAQAEAVAAGRERADALLPGPPALSLSNRNDRLERHRGRQEWEAELAVPLWLPGQRVAQGAVAQSATEEFDARARALRLALAGSLREAWWALAQARVARELAVQRLATAQALAADVTRRYRVGDLARIDDNLARDERLSAAAALAEAESALAPLEQEWQHLTGEAAPATLAAEAPPSLEPVSEHPLAIAASAGARLARDRLRLARESPRDAPEIALRMVRERDRGSEPYESTVGIRVTIPFSSGPRVRQETANARADFEEAMAEQALLEQKLSFEIEQARREQERAERQLEMARERHALAADSLQLMEKSFSLGEADLSALLRVRATASEADAFLARSEIARSAAISRLRQSLGVLP